MAMHRYLTSLLLAAGLASAAEAAHAQGLAVRVYPLTGDPKYAAAIADAQTLLESAFTTFARRSERLVPVTPLVMKALCGRVPGAECLAPHASEGVVIWGTARADKNDIVVTLHAVDGQANVHGPVQTRIDGFLQNAEPIVGALLELEAQLPAAGGAPGATASGKGARAQAPGSTSRHRGSTSRSTWKRTLGRWATGGGLLLLAGGATVTVLNQQLASDLEVRAAKNTLTTADGAKYRQVDTYNTLSTALLVGGGAVTLTGLVLWGIAPDVRPLHGGATFGVQGRF